MDYAEDAATQSQDGTNTEYAHITELLAVIKSTVKVLFKKKCWD